MTAVNARIPSSPTAGEDRPRWPPGRSALGGPGFSRLGHGAHQHRHGADGRLALATVDLGALIALALQEIEEAGEYVARDVLAHEDVLVAIAFDHVELVLRAP